MKYKHIFFDLDDTIWDFDKNAKESLHEIYHTFQLQDLGEQVTWENFYTTFKKVNTDLWKKYNQGTIGQEELRYARFLLILHKLGIKQENIPFKTLSDTYLAITPLKPHLVTDAENILNYLKKKGYFLHIMTNGFQDIQILKLKSSGINNYFNEIISSTNSGAKKPNIKIFQYALKKTATHKDECLIIGDNLETDIEGAFRAEWNSIWFNKENIDHKEEKATHNINSLVELFSIL
jgi:putative hydrolase of the HAD superfamily